MTERLTITPKGMVAFKEERTCLLDMILAAEKHFPGVPQEEIVVSSALREIREKIGGGVVLKRFQPCEFVGATDDVHFCSVVPHVSLAHLVRQAKSLQKDDSTKVVLCWSMVENNWELGMMVKKD